MKKKIILSISMLTVLIIFAGISLGQLGYKGKAVVNGSEKNVNKALEIAKKYKPNETVLIGDMEINKISYEIAKSNRNGSDEETKKYFIRAKSKGKVIMKMAKEYNVRVDKTELDTFMNESFAVLTDNEKKLTASMDGFSTFEDYVKSSRTRSAAESLLLENKLLKAMVNTPRDKVTPEEFEKLMKKAQEKLKEEVDKEIKSFNN